MGFFVPADRHIPVAPLQRFDARRLGLAPQLAAHHRERLNHDSIGRVRPRLRGTHASGSGADPREAAPAKARPRLMTLKAPRYTVAELSHLPVRAHTDNDVAPDLQTRYLRGTPFGWIEYPKIARLATRVAYVNAVLKHVYALLNAHKASVTVVSLGPGRMLTERLLAEKLPPQRIAWRFLEPEMRPGSTTNLDRVLPDMAKHFAYQAYFPTEQAYLQAPDGLGLLAERDRRMGPTVILACDPPTLLDHRLEKQFFVLGASPCTEVAEANAVYVLRRDLDGISKAALNDVLRRWKSGREIPPIDHVGRLSPPMDGMCVTLTSAGVLRTKGRTDTRGLQLQDALANYVGTRAKRLTRLADLVENCREFASVAHTLPTAPGRYHVQPVSDYDVSLQNLRDFFGAGSHPVWTAELRRDKNTFSS